MHTVFKIFTNLELWDSGEDQHDDGGQEEQGAHDHQHLHRGGLQLQEAMK